MTSRYFNLNPVPAVGQPISLSGTSVTLHTQKHHPLSSTGIPISTQAVDFPGVKSGEPFTFTQSRPHIDDAFLVEGYPTQKFKIDTREEDLKVHVTASHPDTKLNLEVLSTEVCQIPSTPNLHSLPFPSTPQSQAAKKRKSRTKLTLTAPQNSPPSNSTLASSSTSPPSPLQQARPSQRVSHCLASASSPVATSTPSTCPSGRTRSC